MMFFLTCFITFIIGTDQVLCAEIWRPLPRAEAGWKRYDDSEITRQVSINVGQCSWKKCYQNTYSYVGSTKDNISRISFQFKGTKLRIIGNPSYYRSNNIIIDIDGVQSRYNQYNETEQGGYLLFEKIGLENKIHTVTIMVDETSTIYWDKYRAFDLDAIDVEDNGEIFSTFSMGVNNKNINLDKGKSFHLNTDLRSSILKVKWTSDNEDVARVDSFGNVTAVGQGTCNISASIEGSNVKDSCYVNVQDNSIIKIKTENHQVKKGDLINLSLGVQGADEILSEDITI